MRFFFLDETHVLFAKSMQVAYTDDRYANNESGYKVYRDGVLLATLPANSTSFVDKPPSGGPYTYEVVAFNEGGASPKASVIVKSCER